MPTNAYTASEAKEAAFFAEMARALDSDDSDDDELYNIFMGVAAEPFFRRRLQGHA